MLKGSYYVQKRNANLFTFGVTKFIFFISGASALIYETVWVRLFAQIIGSTVVAMAVVFIGFLVALALGAFIFGKINKYNREALYLYGTLEIGVAIFAIGSSAVLFYGGSTIAAGLPKSEYLIVNLCIWLFCTFLIVGLPCLLIGGTLPVMINSVRNDPKVRKEIVHFYGWNTLGGACGAMACGFFLIWKFGITGTILFSASLNLCVGFLSFVLGHWGNYRQQSAVEKPVEKLKQVTDNSWRNWLFLAFLSGFTVLAYEIMWGRIAKYFLGETTMAIAALLSVFLICLGISSFIASWFVRWTRKDKSEPSVRTFGWIFAGTAVSHVGVVALISHSYIQPDGDLFERLLVSWALMAIPVTLLGITFPLLAATAKSVTRLPGKVVGTLYVVNTAGAAIGGIAGTLILSRWFGTTWGFAILSGILLLVASGILIRTGKTKSKIIVGVMIVIFAIISVLLPKRILFMQNGEDLIQSNEDEYGTQIMVRTAYNRILLRNNTRDLVRELGGMDTTYAQQIMSHLAVLFASDVEDVLNIGTGYGITAGTFTLYDQVKSIETIEILPFLVKQMPSFREHNFTFYEDPRVKLRIGDGNHLLRVSDQMFNIITVNVLDPNRPGSASLYSVDFWQHAYEHLKPGGVYGQMIWGSDIPLLVRGMKSVFPTLLFFKVYGNDAYYVIGLRDQLSIEQIHPKLDRLTPDARQQLARFSSWEVETLIAKLLVSSQYFGNQLEAAAALTSNQNLHSDNYPILEYNWHAEMN